MSSGRRDHELSWEDVAVLEESGSRETAALARFYLMLAERRRNRWWRRALRRIRG